MFGYKATFTQSPNQFMTGGKIRALTKIYVKFLADIFKTLICVM